MLETNQSFKGEKGLELTTVEWLLDHHKTKLQERRETVDDLNIKAGDVILDLGCGPGLWTHLLAEKVKPNGRVVGVDFSPDLITPLSFEKKISTIYPLKKIPLIWSFSATVLLILQIILRFWKR
jgi:SAM-dependent methyltransferase